MESLPSSSGAGVAVYKDSITEKSTISRMPLYAQLIVNVVKQKSIAVIKKGER